MNSADAAPPMPAELNLGKRLLDEVLAPMKESFVGKDEIIDLMGICLVAGENLFILGPPGTAKSALVYELGRRVHGQTFEYLLTRFTEPNELFGPFDIRKLREGSLETNTEGMLPEADLVFLDELLNANSAILNSLLTVLNERQLRRGREILKLPLLMTVGASNHLPEEEALQALFDRFLLRVVSNNVMDDRLEQVLDAGWKLESKSGYAETVATITAEDIRTLRRLLSQVSLAEVRPSYLALVKRLRTIGIEISDRRAVKLQRLLAASALLCGRLTAKVSDLWLLRFIWDLEEQQELLKSVVQEALEQDKREPGDTHPRAMAVETVDPEQLKCELDRLEADPDSAGAHDRLARLESRIEWIENEEQRAYLAETVSKLWEKLNSSTAVPKV